MSSVLLPRPKRRRITTEPAPFACDFHLICSIDEDAWEISHGQTIPVFEDRDFYLYVGEGDLYVRYIPYNNKPYAHVIINDEEPKLHCFSAEQDDWKLIRQMDPDQEYTIRFEFIQSCVVNEDD